MPESAHAILARDLVARMVAGDRRALARLIDLYGRGLVLYCARALDVAQDAEDATQEVFLRAWRKAATYEPAKGAVSTWLYRIAVNHCSDRNHRSVFRRFLGLEAAGERQDDTPGAARTLIFRAALAAARAEIALLPTRQRQALLLQVIGAMDTSTIAATLGTGTGAVEQLLVRARATLRQRLGADFIVEKGD